MALLDIVLRQEVLVVGKGFYWTERKGVSKWERNWSERLGVRRRRSICQQKELGERN